MQKTQLTEIIEFAEHLKSMPTTELGFTTADQWVKWAAELVINKAIQQLPKEREDMENMAEHGFAENEKWTINAESIFDQHYTQYKP